MDQENNTNNTGDDEEMEVPVSSPEPGQSTTQPTATTPRETEPTESSMGPVIGAIIIIVILIVGGLYLWGKQLSEGDAEMLGDDELTEEIEEQSDSDEIDDIEADLEANEEILDELDSDLENL